jgi:hypothetical protein
MAINMDQFLLKNLTNSAYQFSQMAGYPDTDYYTENAYFFLRRELSEVTDSQTFYRAMRNKRVRHCKPYGSRWLDYTVRKEFDTLADWVADAGDTMENVLYGVNRVHKRDSSASFRTQRFVAQTAKYVTLQHALDYLGYVPPLVVNIPECKAFDSFADMLAEVGVLNGPIPPQGRKCLVQKPNNTIVIGHVVDYRVDETSPSQVCVIVPQDMQFDHKTYSRLSEMPQGTTVYFRTSDGHFHSTDALMSDD